MGRPIGIGGWSIGAEEVSFRTRVLRDGLAVAVVENLTKPTQLDRLSCCNQLWMYNPCEIWPTVSPFCFLGYVAKPFLSLSHIRVKWFHNIFFAAAGSSGSTLGIIMRFTAEWKTRVLFEIFNKTLELRIQLALLSTCEHASMCVYTQGPNGLATHPPPPSLANIKQKMVAKQQSDHLLLLKNDDKLLLLFIKR